MKPSLHSTLLVLLCAFSCSAATIRTKSDLRLWETVADRSAPLCWPWADGAEAATLVFSNRLTRTVSAVTVPRDLGAMRGSCAQPAPQAGETVVDVTLAQTAGANEVSRESATLAYVYGAGGGPIVVRAKDTREWNSIPEPRVHAFDPAWQGELGDSGYDVAWPLYSGLKIILR